MIFQSRVSWIYPKFLSENKFYKFCEKCDEKCLSGVHLLTKKFSLKIIEFQIINFNRI